MENYAGRFAYPSDPTIPTTPEKLAFLLCFQVLKGCREQYKHVPRARADRGNWLPQTSADWKLSWRNFVFQLFPAALKSRESGSLHNQGPAGCSAWSRRGLPKNPAAEAWQMLPCPWHCSAAPRRNSAPLQHRGGEWRGAWTPTGGFPAPAAPGTAGTCSTRDNYILAPRTATLQDHGQRHFGYHGQRPQSRGFTPGWARVPLRVTRQDSPNHPWKARVGLSEPPLYLGILPPATKCAFPTEILHPWKNVGPQVVLNSAPSRDLSPRTKEGKKAFPMHFLLPECCGLSTATKPHTVHFQLMG